MKILLTMNMPYYGDLASNNGALRANRYLAEGLVARGHSVQVVVPAFGATSRLTPVDLSDCLAGAGIAVRTDGSTIRFTINGVAVVATPEVNQLRALLRAQIEAQAPDWVLVSCEDWSQGLLEASLKACPGRVLYLAHSITFLPFGPLAFFPSPHTTRLLEDVAAILACSRYVQSYIHKTSGLDSTVFYWPAYGPGPFPDFAKVNEGFVTLINPCAMKGIGIFLDLARSLPEVAFAAVPTWGTTAADRHALAGEANITVLDPVEDIDLILVRTRILLMPSLWPEGFPLTCIEAMLRGIPVLASTIEGLVEAKLGSGPILPVRPIDCFSHLLDSNQIPIALVPEQDPAPWREALVSLLSDRTLYEKHSRTGREKALQFVAGLGVEPLEEIFVRLAAQRSPVAPVLEAAPTLGKLTPEQQALLMLLLEEATPSFQDMVEPMQMAQLTQATGRPIPCLHLPVESTR